MSVFDDDVIDGSPITAELLNNILIKRFITNNDDNIKRYNKILRLLYDKVNNSDTCIQHYDISCDDLGINGAPFTDEFIDEVNDNIEKHGGKDTDEFLKWAEEVKFVPNEKFKDFIKYFKKRGFQISFYLHKYIKEDKKQRDKCKSIRIDWSQKDID